MAAEKSLGICWTTPLRAASAPWTPSRAARGSQAAAHSRRPRLCEHDEDTQLPGAQTAETPSKSKEVWEASREMWEDCFKEAKSLGYSTRSDAKAGLTKSDLLVLMLI